MKREEITMTQAFVKAANYLEQWGELFESGSVDLMSFDDDQLRAICGLIPVVRKFSDPDEVRFSKLVNKATALMAIRESGLKKPYSDEWII